MMDDLTKRRFESLLVQIEKAGTVAEAETATALFQRQLLKHNITEDEARQLRGDTNDEIKKFRVRLTKKREVGTYWKVNLLFTLTRYNLCKAYQLGGSGSDMLIIGTQRNIDAVQVLYTACVETFQNLADVAYKQFLREWDPEIEWLRGPKPSSRKWKNSFLMGVPVGLARRMKEEQEASRAMVEGANALLVLIDEELNQAEKELVGDKIREMGSFKVGDYGAYESGREAGYRHGTRQVGDGTTDRRIAG